jgi:hypothetical protein
MAGASSASVWAGLSRPVRGIVESWVRAKANPARPGFRPLRGLAGSLGEVPSVGQGVRRCGHVARSAPEAARHPGTTLTLRYSSPNPTSDCTSIPAPCQESWGTRIRTVSSAATRDHQRW